MADNCRFSFSDLYQAVFGRAITAKARIRYSKLAQPERNNVVRRWAKKSGWSTEDRLGADGIVYTAFWKGGES